MAELASSWVATARRPGEANAINLGQTLAAFRAAKRLACIVVVFMHWGTEGMACPDQNQLSLAPKLAAAGASIIIGVHAHMLQASGWLGHTFVAYGMGNFLWWENACSPSTSSTTGSGARPSARDPAQAQVAPRAGRANTRSPRSPRNQRQPTHHLPPPQQGVKPPA